jgi:hypothetical protein
MKFKLSQILESTILLEGRKEDTLKKYGEEHSELIDMLSEVDPSGNNKYLDWMVKTALGKNQDSPVPTADMVARSVADFHRLLARIRNKDINSYKSLEELKTVIDEAKSAEEEKKVAKQAKLVFSNDVVDIYAPFTWEASCKYGAGSKWCVTMKDNPSYFNNNYGKDNFYFFLRKDVGRAQDSRGYKYALQVKYGDLDNVEWWDAEDSPTNGRTPSFVTSEMMDAVRDFNPAHKKIKLGAKAKAFIDNPNVNDYKTYSDMLTPEQKNSVIDKIIKSGNLNSNTFTILSADLNDEQKMEFITNYVKGQVSASDYNNMKNNLNKNQKLTLVKFNPSILNNYDIMKEMNNELTDDEKYKISKVIDAKQINNTDSKVLFRKWSMTPEERKKHGSTSFYVFLSSSGDFVEKLVKVDPLDPESYRTINMMKLRKQVQPDTKMFGIKTESGLLDEFVGSSSGSIPEDMIEMIKSKATSI